MTCPRGGSDRACGRVSAENAKDAAQEWLAAADLPEDLSGRVVQLVVFSSEEDCRFFFPRRALIWQQMVNTCISKAVRKRKGTVKRVMITPGLYQATCAEAKIRDTPEERWKFAMGFQRLLPVDAE